MNEAEVKVISMSNDLKHAMVVVTQFGERVTRHAHLIPGTVTKFTIWKRPSWMKIGDTREEIETITIPVLY